MLNVAVYSEISTVLTFRKPVRLPAIVFSSEVETGSRDENAPERNRELRS